MTRRTPCRFCGIPLVWLTELDPRPLEATPHPPAPNEAGYVVAVVNGKRAWQPTSACREMPPEHLRVHVCAKRVHRGANVQPVGAGLDMAIGGQR